MTHHEDTLTTAGARKRSMSVTMTWHEPRFDGHWSACTLGKSQKRLAWVRETKAGHWQALTINDRCGFFTEAEAKAWCEAMMRHHVALILS